MSLVVALTVYGADQLTKHCVLALFTLGQSLPVIPGIFHITLVHNTGGAFGVLRQQPAVFHVLSVVAILWLAAWLWRMRRPAAPRPLRVSLAAILGGACGNLTDRIWHGHVVDFLDFRVWPVFNLADTAITIGVGLLIWHMWRDGRTKKPAESEVRSW